MAFWLVKSEPLSYSWDQLVRDKRTSWTGVRNFQAANNLRAMKAGDRAFFYHSSQGKEIVGISEILTGAYPDATDTEGRFVAVDIAALKPLKKTVSLAEMKKTEGLENFALLKQSRLSVVPVKDAEWKILSKLAGEAS
ncbi:MAG: EVE domain-containing protein [Dongiaceae bacterium]